jgi:hypothetical protein
LHPRSSGEHKSASLSEVPESSKWGLSDSPGPLTILGEASTARLLSRPTCRDSLPLREQPKSIASRSNKRGCASSIWHGWLTVSESGLRSPVRVSCPHAAQPCAPPCACHPSPANSFSSARGEVLCRQKSERSLLFDGSSGTVGLSSGRALGLGPPSPVYPVRLISRKDGESQRAQKQTLECSYRTWHLIFDATPPCGSAGSGSRNAVNPEADHAGNSENAYRQGGARKLKLARKFLD